MGVSLNHMAGLGALLSEAYPTAARQQLKTFCSTSAVPWELPVHSLSVPWYPDIPSGQRSLRLHPSSFSRSSQLCS